jgi:hypothetical protein
MKSTSFEKGKIPKSGLVHPVPSILDNNISCEIGQWNRLWIDRTLSQAFGKTVFRKRREHKPKGAREVRIFRSLLLNPSFEISERSIHGLILELEGTLPRVRYQDILASLLLA